MGKEKERYTKESAKLPPQPVIEEEPVVSLGVIYEEILELGAENGIVFTKGDAAERIYTSGSVKNEGTAEIFIRLECSSFAGGYADIPLEASESIVFKRLPLNAIFAPNSPANDGVTPAVRVVATPYIANKQSTSGPEIQLK